MTMKPLTEGLRKRTWKQHTDDARRPTAPPPAPKPTPTYKTDGLIFPKYFISKVNGNPIDPEAEYFVLRLDTDPHARKAAVTYAQSVKPENPKFSADIFRWVRKLNMMAYSRIRKQPSPESIRANLLGEVNNILGGAVFAQEHTKHRRPADKIKNMDAMIKRLSAIHELIMQASEGAIIEAAQAVDEKMAERKD